MRMRRGSLAFLRRVALSARWMSARLTTGRRVRARLATGGCKKDRFHLVEHDSEAEFFQDKLSARVAKAQAQLRVAKESHDRFAERRRIPGGNDAAGVILTHRLHNAADRRADHRDGATHGLQDGLRYALVGVRRQHEDIKRLNPGHDICLIAGHQDTLLQSESIDLPGKCLALRAIANNEEPETKIGEPRSLFEYIAMSFPVAQRGDDAQG